MQTVGRIIFGRSVGKIIIIVSLRVGTSKIKILIIDVL